MSTEENIEVGDVFNETDDDKDQRILKINSEKDPPTAICRSIKRDSESDETEEEYHMDYVRDHVSSRKQYEDAGYNEIDVYDIYRMKKKTIDTCANPCLSEYRWNC